MIRNRKSRPPRRIPIARYPISSSTYPGRRPRFSFLFTSKGIYRVKLNTLGKFLQTRGLPSLADRYAVVACGSNACPQQLLNKGLTDVPVIYGRLAGAEAFYAARRTQKGKGYVPATLGRKPGRRASWVTLLTREQLAVMDHSEGRDHNTYALAQLPVARFLVGRRQFVPLYTYVNVFRGVMIRNGNPVSLRSTSQKRARQLLATATEGQPADFLDYIAIPNPEPPARYSRILRR